MPEKTLERLLDSKEIKPVNLKGNLCWIFIRRTDDEALILWPPDAKGQFIGKDLDAGKDWGQEEKGTTTMDNAMVGWHHWLYGHEFEPTQDDSDGQGGLECRSPWGHKQSNTTEHLNSNKGWSDEERGRQGEGKTQVGLVGRPTPSSILEGLKSVQHGPCYSIAKWKCIVRAEAFKEEWWSLQLSASDASWGFINNLWWGQRTLHLNHKIWKEDQYSKGCLG